MYRKAIFPGKYIQGVGAIAELPALVNLLGKQGLILAARSAARILPGCGIDLKAQGIAVDVFRGECCESELSRIFAIVSQHKVDVLVGMGGGKTIDAAKIVADRRESPSS